MQVGANCGQQIRLKPRIGDEPFAITPGWVGERHDASGLRRAIERPPVAHCPIDASPAGLLSEVPALRMASNNNEQLDLR
jgi:hypothetical protein